MSRRPRVRRDELLCREVAGDLVVYDLRTHRAYCLDADAAQLWSWCDGETTPAEMAGRLPYESHESESHEEELRAVRETVVLETLRRLNRAELLQPGWYPPAKAATYSRRRCVGALVALPMITGILVPRAADAQSLPPGSPCSSSSQCSTGCCSSASNRCTGGGPSCL